MIRLRLSGRLLLGLALPALLAFADGAVQAGTEAKDSTHARAEKGGEPPAVRMTLEPKAIAERLAGKAEKFKAENGYEAPYRELLKLARAAKVEVEAEAQL